MMRTKRLFSLKTWPTFLLIFFFLRGSYRLKRVESPSLQLFLGRDEQFEQFGSRAPCALQRALAVWLRARV